MKHFLSFLPILTLSLQISAALLPHAQDETPQHHLPNVPQNAPSPLKGGTDLLQAGKPNHDLPVAGPLRPLAPSIPLLAEDERSERGLDKRLEGFAWPADTDARVREPAAAAAAPSKPSVPAKHTLAGKRLSLKATPTKHKQSTKKRPTAIPTRKRKPSVRVTAKRPSPTHKKSPAKSTLKKSPAKATHVVREAMLKSASTKLATKPKPTPLKSTHSTPRVNKSSTTRHAPSRPTSKRKPTQKPTTTPAKKKTTTKVTKKPTATKKTTTTPTKKPTATKGPTKKAATTGRASSCRGKLLGLCINIG